MRRADLGGGAREVCLLQALLQPRRALSAQLQLPVARPQLCPQRAYRGRRLGLPRGRLPQLPREAVDEGLCRAVALLRHPECRLRHVDRA